MSTLNFEETNLAAIYNRADRKETIHALEEMREYLQADETELRELTESTLAKLRGMSDREFDALDLIPDFSLEDFAYGK